MLVKNQDFVLLAQGVSSFYNKGYATPMTLSIVIGALILIVVLAVAFKLLKTVARMILSLVTLVAIAAALWFFREPLMNIYQQIIGGV